MEINVQRTKTDVGVLVTLFVMTPGVLWISELGSKNLSGRGINTISWSAQDFRSARVFPREEKEQRKELFYHYCNYCVKSCHASSSCVDFTFLQGSHKSKFSPKRKASRHKVKRGDKDSFSKILHSSNKFSILFIHSYVQSPQYKRNKKKTKMGSSVSKAKQRAAETDNELKSLMTILENKRDQFLSLVELTRGDGSNATKEVQGGRTVSRVSEIRVSTTDGADPGIGDAISDFFQAAQGGDNAKTAAVKGAQGLLESGINALFGAGEGTGMEKRGFVVLFLNYAFVRIDFMVYTYSVKGTEWGAVANRSGSCYVADIAVLDPMKDIKASEIDYLLAQSFAVDTPAGADAPEAGEKGSEWNAIMKMKIQLVQSVILSRMLEKDNIALADIRDYTDELIATQAKIQEAFGSLEDYKPAAVEAAGGDGNWRKRRSAQRRSAQQERDTTNNPRQDKRRSAQQETDETITPREVLARFHQATLFFLELSRHPLVRKLNR